MQVQLTGQPQGGLVWQQYHDQLQATCVLQYNQQLRAMHQHQAARHLTEYQQYKTASSQCQMQQGWWMVQWTMLKFIVTQNIEVWVATLYITSYCMSLVLYMVRVEHVAVAANAQTRACSTGTGA